MFSSKNAYYETITGLFNLASYGAGIELRIVINKLNFMRLPQLAEFIQKNLPFVEWTAFMGMEYIGYAVKNENKEEKLKILFNKCIPVKEGTKYGLYSMAGEELLSCFYDRLGSVTLEGQGTNGEDNVLLIPRELGIEGIVVSQNGMYGIYDVNVKNLIIPIVCTRVYSITKAAKTTYYVEYNGEQIELDSYLEQQGLKSIQNEEVEENNEQTDENTELQKDNETVENVNVTNVTVENKTN